MTVPVTIEKLVSDHAALRSHAAALAAAVTSVQALDANVLQNLRWTLMREAHQHLVLDERFVHIPLESHPTRTVREKAAELRRDAERFRAHWTSHAAYWSTDRIQANRRSYGVALRKLLTEMHVRLEREELELYPLMGSGNLSDIGSTGYNWAGDALQLRGDIYGR